MENITVLFDAKRWEEIALSYTPLDIVKKLDFKRGMIVAYKLLYNEKWNEESQEFAIKLLDALKKTYAYEWNACWRYEAFLGLACDITLKYDERYHAYRQAYEKLVDPPPELLIELARCCYSPGLPHLSYEQSIEFLRQSIEKHPYKEAASLLKAIYSSKKESENEEYWSKMLQNIKDENPPSLEPSFLREI